MEFYQLEQFLAIVEYGTLSKAAEYLHISQPGLTRSMQKLEEELALSLFDHKKNKITLNDNGILAADFAKKILQERDQMINQLQLYDKRKHTISIGSCAPVPIWGLTYIFHKLYPETKVEHAICAQEADLWKGLKEHQYSIIVVTHPYQDETYTSVELFEEHLYLSVPPAHPFALFKELSFQDLDGESVLLLSRIGFWNEICLKMIPQSHLLIQNDTDTFHELTRLSALPNFRSNITMMREENEDHRVTIPIIDKEASATYYAIYHKNDHKRFSSLQAEASIIDWKKTRTEND